MSNRMRKQYQKAADEAKTKKEQNDKLKVKRKTLEKAKKKK